MNVDDPPPDAGTPRTMKPVWPDTALPVARSSSAPARQWVNGHRRLLHDGRADGVAEAIGWHGGEAAVSRHKFFALDAAEQRQLLDYVERR